MRSGERTQILALIEQMKQAASNPRVDELSQEIKTLLADSGDYLAGPRTKFMGKTMVVDMGYPRSAPQMDAGWLAVWQPIIDVLRGDAP